ncbi:hypothetical protein CBM2629_A20010 [Cupriavidus taiwanensis]|nr:hypothetical protein CBM2629_A20010 [Cupriavidus taiwanensis]
MPSIVLGPDFGNIPDLPEAVSNRLRCWCYAQIASLESDISTFGALRPAAWCRARRGRRVAGGNRRLLPC